MPTTTVAAARPARRTGITFKDRPPVRHLVPVVTHRDGEPVTRVRGLRTQRTKGFANYVEITETFLDGTEHKTTVRRGETPKEEWTMADPIGTVRTNDYVDFGRLQQAASQLISLCQAIQAQGTEPSHEQMSSIMRTRANLIAWRTEARRQLRDAESKIEVVDEVVAHMLG